MDVHKLNDVYYPKQNFMVIVKTITYNQARYIQDTLNGIAMQITDFPFVNVVLEDNSTDGEQGIIKSWLHKECKMSQAEYYDIPTANVIIVPHTSNANCLFAVYFHKENLYCQVKKRESQLYPWRLNSEYEAWCEGDDYWVDPFKLQKQFQYMKSHPNCSLVHTAFNFFFQRNEVFCNSNFDQEIYNRCVIEKKNIACEIIDFKYRVVTATSFFRVKQYLELENSEYYSKHKFMLSDIQLWTMLLQFGEIGYLSDITSVYRVHENSACRQVDMKSDARMCLSISEMQLHFLPKVKGGEYLKSRFCMQFRKNLFKYLLFDPAYVSFISDKDCEIPVFFSLLLKYSTFRSMMIACLKYKRKMFNNSVVKIKGI